MMLPKPGLATSVCPEPYPNQLLRTLSYFFLGAFFLSSCATLQKLLFSVPLEWRGYSIPLFVGGSFGVVVGSGVYRYRQLCFGQVVRQDSVAGSSFALLRQVFQFALFFSAGSSLFCLLALLQKSLAGYPIELKMFTVPALFGGFSGVSIGWYVLELKRSHRYRLEDERQYYNLFENANDMIQMVSLDGRILYANQAWRDAIGCTAEELAEINIFQVIHPDCLQETEQKMRRMLKGFDVPRMELKYVRRNGETIHVEGSSSISLVRGKPNGFRCILRDISERKRQEEQLKKALQDTRKAHGKLDRVLNSVADGILLIDQDLRIALSNPAVARLLGIAQGDLNNCMLYEAIPFLPIGQIEDDSCREFILCVPATDDCPDRYLRALLAPLDDGSAMGGGTILSLHDVTREKELDRMKREFISAAAHELRSPLTSIIGFSEYLLKSPEEEPAEQRRMVNTIYEQAVTLSERVGELQNLSRIESGKGLVLEQSCFSMSDLIRQTVAQLQPETSPHRLELKLSESDGTIFADRGKIRQVIENIISNAIKYSPDGGTIRIHGQAAEGYYVFRVEDSGIGMNPEQSKRIFEKFYRADYGNPKIPGTGLGMSIVQQIVQAHCGQIKIDSRPGEGSRVQVLLPQA